MARLDATAFLDSLGCAHVLYFHDDSKITKDTEFGFIKKGVEKQEHCFYTTQNPEKVLAQMKEFGIDTEASKEFLHMVEIPEKFEDYSKMILGKVDELPHDSTIRVLSTHYFDFNSEKSAEFDLDALGVLFPEGIEFVYQPNPEISYNGSLHKKESLISNGLSIPVNITAQELLLGEGEDGVDTFSLLAAMERALLENDGIAIAKRIDQLNLAQNQVLKQQADVGNIVRELYSTQSRLENQQFEKERQLSDIQDLDVAEATVDLKVAEANNILSLNTGARLIQPSLSDFLR